MPLLFVDLDYKPLQPFRIAIYKDLWIWNEKLKLVIDKFNIQWSSTCKSKDYLFVGQIKTYTKTWLCGSSVPNDFSALISKKKAMTVRFVSNGSGRKSGFKVRVIATSWSDTQLLSSLALSLRFTSHNFYTLIDELTADAKIISWTGQLEGRDTALALYT